MRVRLLRNLGAVLLVGAVAMGGVVALAPASAPAVAATSHGIKQGGKWIISFHFKGDKVRVDKIHFRPKNVVTVGKHTHGKWARKGRHLKFRLIHKGCATLYVGKWRHKEHAFVGTMTRKPLKKGTCKTSSGHWTMVRPIKVKGTWGVKFTFKGHKAVSTTIRFLKHSVVRLGKHRRGHWRSHGLVLRFGFGGKKECHVRWIGTWSAKDQAYKGKMTRKKTSLCSADTGTFTLTKAKKKKKK